MTFPLPEGECRIVCRPKRARPRTWTSKAILRVIVSYLEDGNSKDVLCGDLYELLRCGKCDCEGLVRLAGELRSIIKLILKDEIREGLLKFQDFIDEATKDNLDDALPPGIDPEEIRDDYYNRVRAMRATVTKWLNAGASRLDKAYKLIKWAWRLLQLKGIVDSLLNDLIPNLFALEEVILALADEVDRVCERTEETGK